MQNQTLETLIKSIPLVEQRKLEIVIVDDNFEFKDVLSYPFEKYNFEIKFFNNPNEALDYLKANIYNTAMILSDYSMPLMNGFGFREETLKFAPTSIPFYLISGVIDIEQALGAIQLKIHGFLEKQNVDDKVINETLENLSIRLNEIKDEREMLFGFVDDAGSMIEQMESLSLSMDNQEDVKELFNKMLGIAHTIKGASSFFEPKYLHNYIHKYEDYLKAICNSLSPISEAQIELSFKAIDDIKYLLRSLAIFSKEEINIEQMLAKFFETQINETAQTEVKKSEAKDTKNANAQQNISNSNDYIKIEKKILDQFMYASGEMTVVRNMLNKISNLIEKKYSNDKDVLSLSELLDELHKINLGVQNKISDLRKVQVNTILKPKPRLVRDV